MALREGVTFRYRQLEYRPIHNPHLQTFNQFVVRYCVEIPFQIRVVDRLKSLFQMLPYLSQRIVGRTVGTEPVRAIHKVRFKDRLNDQYDGRLYNPITDGRYAQGALAAIRLGDVPPSYRRCMIALFLQAVMDLIQKTFDTSFAGLDFLEADTIDTRRAFVLTRYPIGTFKHVTPIDPVRVIRVIRG